MTDLAWLARAVAGALAFAALTALVGAIELAAVAAPFVLLYLLLRP